MQLACTEAVCKAVKSCCMRSVAFLVYLYASTRCEFCFRFASPQSNFDFVGMLGTALALYGLVPLRA